jgi:hypothetical protein
MHNIQQENLCGDAACTTFSKRICAAKSHAQRSARELVRRCHMHNVQQENLCGNAACTTFSKRICAAMPHAQHSARENENAGKQRHSQRSFFAPLFTDVRLLFVYKV